VRELQGLAASLALLVLLAPAAQAKGVAAQRGPALDYLADHVDGAGPMTANIAEAAHANGLDLAAWPTEDDPVVAHLPVEFPEDAANITLLRPLRALAFAGHPAAAADGDLTARAYGKLGPHGYGDRRTFNDDAYALLALRAAGLAVDDRLQATRDHLLAAQGQDGGWGWTLGSPSDTDMTSLVVEALHATGGVPGEAAAHARDFLATTRSSAGFGETSGSEPNCESTVWGIRATQRLGAAPRDDDWWFLLSLQQRDGGFAHLPGGTADLLCTSEAATLLGEAHAGEVAAPAMEDRGIPALGGLLVAVVVFATLRVRRP
jgi:hypothetical protein